MKWWITINEPSVIVWEGYGNGTMAPGVKDPLCTTFKVTHNLIKCHARAYRAYEKDFKPTQKGTPEKIYTHTQR